MNPVSAKQNPNTLETLEKLSLHERLWILTGAGISAASGIPAYRDHERNWQHGPPMQHADFMNNEISRKRYWSRSMVGWPTVANAKPNPAHHAITKIQQRGKIKRIVTQNVDRLHSKAGAVDVIDLHGRLDLVTCMGCGDKTSRGELQSVLEANNPDFILFGADSLPDGDAKLERPDLEKFILPTCAVCNGMIKPDVVFYGGSVPRERVDAAMEDLVDSDGVLIVGNSLSVFSALRFIKRAKDIGLPVYAINLGKIRESQLIDYTIREDCIQALPWITEKIDTDPIG